MTKKPHLTPQLDKALSSNGAIRSFKGRPLTIVVEPGSFGTVYMPLNGWMKAHNRSVNERHKSRLRNSWNEELAGLVTLVINETGDKLYIVDGQNRLAVCSEMTEPQILFARVYQYHEIPMDVTEWVSQLNANQKRFTLDDHLETHQAYSSWPRIFKEEGLEPMFLVRAAVPQWSHVIRGAYYGLSLKQSGEMIPPIRARLHEIIKFWREGVSDADLRSLAHFNKWWYECVRNGRGHKVTGLTALAVMGIAYAIYDENKNHPSINKARDRLIGCKASKMIKVYQAGQEENLSLLRTALLSGLNHGTRTNLLTLFGVTGRG